jgi:hypothetical protein
MFSLGSKENIHALKVIDTQSYKVSIINLFILNKIYNDILNKYNKNMCNKLDVCNN